MQELLDEGMSLFSPVGFKVTHLKIDFPNIDR